MSRQKPGEGGASEGARRATGEASASPRGGRGRWSAGRKVSVVLELLRGTDLETLSRRHGVTAAKISEWRDAFLAGGAAHLRSRETHVDDEETQRLKRVVTEQAVSQELLREKIRALEASGPLGWWRSKR